MKRSAVAFAAVVETHGDRPASRQAEMHPRFPHAPQVRVVHAMTTRKPKTARRTRFTGALAQPIVRTDTKLAIMAAILSNKDTSEIFRAAQAKIDEEIVYKLNLLAAHYGIDTSPDSGDVLPRLAMALCHDLIGGFAIVDHTPKRGRPAENWTDFYKYIKNDIAIGKTITESCSLYRSTLTGRKPTVATLENRFRKCDLEEKMKSDQAADRLLQAVMNSRRREPDWMTQLRDPKTDET